MDEKKADQVLNYFEKSQVTVLGLYDLKSLLFNHMHTTNDWKKTKQIDCDNFRLLLYIFHITVMS